MASQTIIVELDVAHNYIKTISSQTKTSSNISAHCKS